MGKSYQQNQTFEASYPLCANGEKPQRRGGSKRLRFVTDGLLAACLLVLLLAPEGLDIAHKVAGIAITVLLVVHTCQHRTWFRALPRGRWNAKRARSAVLVALVLSFMAFMVASGFLVPGTRSEFDVVGAATLVGSLHRFMALVCVCVATLHSFSARSPKRR